MKVYIGYDPREEDAYLVAEASMTRRATVPLEITPLSLDRLQAWGLLSRPMDRRGGMYDMASGAPMSTEFAISRFLVPMLAQTGWALFVDADVVFMTDVAELFSYADATKAVHVVKHTHSPTTTVKMDGQVQTIYPRKNWSSVILWNCNHPANRRLSLHDVNMRRGLDLHGFYWLHDSEIGELPAGANWLVGEQPKPDRILIAHFTAGGPWFKDWQPRQYDEIWLNEAKRLQLTQP